MAQNQNNDEVNELVAKLGRDLCGMRRQCLDRFSDCLPLLRLWSCQAREKLAKKGYRLTNDFETRNRHNQDKVSVSVVDARATFPDRLRDFQNRIEQFLATGKSPSKKERSEIKLTFSGFNPKFSSVRKLALQCDETPLAIRQLFERYDEIRGLIVDNCAPVIKKAVNRVVKYYLQEADREDMLSSATLLAMIALDRYDVEQEQDGGLQGFVATSVEKDATSFMRRYREERRPSIFDRIRDDVEGASLVETRPDPNVLVPDEIVAENEVKELMVERLAKCADDPDVRLFLRYSGVPDGDFDLNSLNALLDENAGQTTYKQLGEEESVTPQAIQKRCKRGCEKIKKALRDSHENDDGFNDNRSLERSAQSRQDDNKSKGIDARRGIDPVPKRRSLRKSLKSRNVGSPRIVGAFSESL